MRKPRKQVAAELVKEFEKKVEEVLDWQEQHPEFRLIDLEEYLQEVGRELMGRIAEGVIEQKESQSPVAAPQCEGCGETMVNKGQKRKQVVTQVGEIEVARSYYYCQHCQRGFFPPGSRTEVMDGQLE